MDGKATEYDKDLENIKSAIQIKFKLNDRLNKQLAQLVEAAGGKEDDPLHLKVNTHLTLLFRNFLYISLILTISLSCAISSYSQDT